MDSAVELAVTLEDAVPRPELPAAAGAPYRGRIEFRLFEAQRQGFLADARKARADLYPQLSWIGQYGVDSLRFSLHDRGYASFLHLNVPIFDFFRARSAARQSELQAQQVELQRRVSERAFARDYGDALSRVELIYAQIALTQNQVTLAGDNLRLSRVRYEGGEGSALDVVAAQSQLTQARTNYYTAKANYLNARADLEIASGR
jgi:outer membrane protein TolC